MNDVHDIYQKLFNIYSCPSSRQVGFDSVIMEKNIENKIKTNNIDFVQLENVDINGVSRSYLCDADFFINHVQHKGFPTPVGTIGSFSFKGDLIEGTGLSGAINYRNGMLKPDLETFQIMPTLKNTAVLFGDFFFPNNSTFNGVCCRSACKTQLARLQNLGYHFFSAMEYEFYTVNKETLLPLYQDINLNATEVHNKVRPIIQDIMTNLKTTGCRPEVYHAQMGPAQQEVTIMPEFGITGVDNAYRYKSIVKDSCRKHDVDALFLSKPYDVDAGSSCHFNHSLWDLDKKTNVFWDDSKSDKFSDVCRYWIGGLQEHSKALTALSCHTYNCYGRIIELNMNNSWGANNRTVCFRMKNQSHSHTYIENRIPGAGLNPYLATIGCLIAGIDGIERKIEPKSELFSGNLYDCAELPRGIETLPRNLEEAVKCLQDDEVFVRELGDVFMKAFSEVKKDEILKGKERDSLDDKEEKWKWYRSFYHPFI